MKVIKKSKTKVTEKLRKKYGACEHDKVSYKELTKGFDQLFIAHRRVCRDNDRKGIILEKIVTEKKQQLKNIGDQKAKQLDILKNLYVTKINEMKANYNEVIDSWAQQNEELKTDLKECHKINKDILKKNRDCIKKNKNILKDHHEITRAYNGLHQMGKFAEEEGIDIKKHNRQLPENMEFHQSHELMESGRVKHVYGIKKKNKKKNGETK